MSDGSEIERFVKDPGLLVELCREVIDEIDAGTDETDSAEREAQLREIAKAIERLEKVGVSVPDVLRAEKTRLAASLRPDCEPSCVAPASLPTLRPRDSASIGPACPS